ncbi:hypothetical protein T484DRAFT_1812277 [Baffinella frigidus]|nr:hypothetical protein T484DRAFT_1812277 [Cryptophyta sp. CCMP2293]
MGWAGSGGGSPLATQEDVFEDDGSGEESDGCLEGEAAGGCEQFPMEEAGPCGVKLGQPRATSISSCEDCGCWEKGVDGWSRRSSQEWGSDLEGEEGGDEVHNLISLFSPMAPAHGCLPCIDSLTPCITAALSSTLPSPVSFDAYDHGRASPLSYLPGEYGGDSHALIPTGGAQDCVGDPSLAPDTPTPGDSSSWHVPCSPASCASTPTSVNSVNLEGADSEYGSRGSFSKVYTSPSQIVTELSKLRARREGRAGGGVAAKLSVIVTSPKGVAKVSKSQTCISTRRPPSPESTRHPPSPEFNPHTSRRLGMPHISTLGGSLPPIPQPYTPSPNAHTSPATTQPRFDCVARVDATQRYSVAKPVTPAPHAPYAGRRPLAPAYATTEELLLIVQSSTYHAHQLDVHRRRKSTEGTSWTGAPRASAAGRAAPHVPYRLRGSAERGSCPTEKLGVREWIARGGGGGGRRGGAGQVDPPGVNLSLPGAQRSRGDARPPIRASVDAIFLREGEGRAGAAVATQFIDN